MEQRSPAIDYLRAFAVLWVVLYHFCSISIFKTGYYGVLLFFSISGYCIAHSAATSKTPWHFYAKRVGRLAPALLACSFITVAFKHMAPQLIDNSRQVPWRDLFYSWIALPTLNLPGAEYSLPDGAYWSLLVEFRFYVVVFAAMLIGMRRHILSCVCAFAAICAVFKGRDPDFYPFFIAGVAVAEMRSGRRVAASMGLAFAFLLDLYFLLKGHEQPSAPVAFSRTLVLWLGTAALLTAASFKVPEIARRAMVPVAYVGLVSYPLYLIHQDAGKMVLHAVGIEYSDMLGPRLVALLVVPVVLTLVAGIIHSLVERPMIKPLTEVLSGFSVTDTQRDRCSA